MNDHEFFYEATMRICGSLDIEAVFQNCFAYIKKYIPIDSIDCNLRDPDTGKVNIIAWASNLQLNPPLEQSFLLSRASQAALDVFNHKSILTDFEGDMAISRELASIMGVERLSIMGLHLELKDHRIAVVGVLNRKPNIFTPKHARLLEMLRGPFTIAISNYLRYQEVLKLKDLLQDDNRYLQNELRRTATDEIVGEQFGLFHVMEMIRQVAPLNTHVLLLGETGVGKEIMANALHNLSPRRNEPFITVNCGAIPENLIDSELFGHEKGAFTGATAMKRGRFERADKGSIFLDEIGELPAAAQIRLLRVLQEKKIERVGGSQSIKLDVRVIAATHRNLDLMVKKGQFREDLWYRLNVFPITIPPLRQRKADIPAFVDYFINRKAGELSLLKLPEVSTEVITSLQAYDWPGNVRELENVVERALIRSQTQPFEQSIGLTGMEVSTPNAPASSAISPETVPQEICDLEEINRHHITRILNLAEGKVQGKNGAAALLGVNPGTLRSRMRKLGIPFGRKTK